MSTHTSPGAIPEWDVIDRMRKSLRYAGLDSNAIADLIAVRRETVSRWLSGKITPNVRTLRSWAMATGVDYIWLATGRAPGDDGGTPVDSNMPNAALAQSAERFTRNEEWNGSRSFSRQTVAA